MSTSQTLLRSHHATRRSGFTLVELLVSIVIIITLAALVFAVTGKVRDSARQTVAMSALRQIALANVTYYSENNGTINVIRDANESGPYERAGGRWASDTFMGRTARYLFTGLESLEERAFAEQVKTSLETLFQTTDLNTMEGTIFDGVPVTTDGSGIRNPISVSTSLRPKWGINNPPLSVSSFGDPAQVLYLTYGRYYFDLAQASKYVPMPTQAERSLRTPYYLKNRKGFFAFLDGHVEMLNPPVSERFFPERPAN